MNYSISYQSWLLEKLCKRKKGVYGPDGGVKGTILIDDITAPSPDEFGDVTMHEQIIELLDTTRWYIDFRYSRLRFYFGYIYFSI